MPLTSIRIIVPLVWMHLFMLPANGIANEIVSGDEIVSRVERPVEKAIATRQDTQREEERWRAARDKMLARLEALELENKHLQIRQEQLRTQVAAARERITAKETQMADIDQIGSLIGPFIDEMIVQLRASVDDSLPFLINERRARVDRLTDLAADPEVAVSEKFRKMMEALMIEAEYGNTTEVYQATITVGENAMLTNIFRLGRMSLFYQTLDQKNCGVYNMAAADWQSLPRTFNQAIQTAIEIGAKRKPVELLTLPLGRMAGR